MFDAFSSHVQPAQLAGGEKHGLRSANPSRTLAAIRGSTAAPASPPAPDPFEPPPPSAAPPVRPPGAPASIPPLPLAPPEAPAMPATSPIPPAAGPPAPPAPVPEDRGEHAAGSKPIAHSETMTSTAARREVPTISTAARAAFWSIIPASTDIRGQWNRWSLPGMAAEASPDAYRFRSGGLDGAGMRLMPSLRRVGKISVR